MSKEKKKEVDLSKLQSVVPQMFGGEGGEFDKAVTLAIDKWDEQKPFVAMDLGCGGGQNQVPLILLMKEKLRKKKKDAKILVFQMEYGNAAVETLKKSASKFVDKNCSSFFLEQSFYDTYDFSKAVRTDGLEEKENFGSDLRVNVIFSQSALHWVKDLQKLSMKSLKSDETRKYSKKSMGEIFGRMEEKLASHGVVSCTCLGIDANDEGWGSFSHAVEGYTETFSGVLNESDCKKYLSAFYPQAPRYLTDLESLVRSRKQLNWIKGGKFILTIPKHLIPSKPTQEYAEKVAKGMLGVSLWKDRFVEIFPERKGELDEFWKKAEAQMAKCFLRRGFRDKTQIIFFVFQKAE